MFAIEKLGWNIFYNMYREKESQKMYSKKNIGFLKCSEKCRIILIEI